MVRRGATWQERRHWNVVFPGQWAAMEGPPCGWEGATGADLERGSDSSRGAAWAQGIQVRGFELWPENQYTSSGIPFLDAVATCSTWFEVATVM